MNMKINAFHHTQQETEARILDAAKGTAERANIREVMPGVFALNGTSGSDQFDIARKEGRVHMSVRGSQSSVAHSVDEKDYRGAMIHTGDGGTDTVRNGADNVAVVGGAGSNLRVGNSGNMVGVDARMSERAFVSNQGDNVMVLDGAGADGILNQGGKNFAATVGEGDGLKSTGDRTSVVAREPDAAVSVLGKNAIVARSYGGDGSDGSAPANKASSTPPPVKPESTAAGEAPKKTQARRSFALDEAIREPVREPAIPARETANAVQNAKIESYTGELGRALGRDYGGARNVRELNDVLMSSSNEVFGESVRRLEQQSGKTWDQLITGAGNRADGDWERFASMLPAGRQNWSAPPNARNVESYKRQLNDANGYLNDDEQAISSVFANASHADLRMLHAQMDLNAYLNDTFTDGSVLKDALKKRLDAAIAATPRR